MLGQKTARKGLWNRLTMQGGVDPLVALAIAYACYPSPNQPLALRARVDAQRASQVVADYLDRGAINLDTCCNSLFGMNEEQVVDAILEDDTPRSGTFFDLLKR